MQPIWPPVLENYARPVVPVVRVVAGRLRGRTSVDLVINECFGCNRSTLHRAGDLTRHIDICRELLG